MITGNQSIPVTEKQNKTAHRQSRGHLQFSAGRLGLSPHCLSLPLVTLSAHTSHSTCHCGSRSMH